MRIDFFQRPTFIIATLLSTAGTPYAQQTANAVPPVVASDLKTEYSVDGRQWKPTVATWVHPAWPAVPGATWLWRSKFVTPQEAHDGSEVVTFRREFSWAGAAGTIAVIQIAVDNAYDLSINGVHVAGKGKLDAASGEDQLWHTPDKYQFPLRKGPNEIVVRAMNYHAPSGSSDPQVNPAGVLFRVDLLHEDAATLAAAIKSTGNVNVYGILFDIDKTTLKPESKATLNEVAKLLKNDPSLKLEVAGHTDNTGTRQHNLTLSNGRANAVAEALVKNYGIDHARLQPRGYGDTKPVTPNDTEANRAKNRRVELRKL